MASAAPEPASPEGEAAGAVLLARCAVVLLASGQTTEGVRLAVERLSLALGRPTRLQARWGELTLHAPDDSAAFVEAEPAGIDITRVAAAEAVVDAVCAATLGPSAALERLGAIERAGQFRPARDRSGLSCRRSSGYGREGPVVSVISHPPPRAR